MKETILANADLVLADEVLRGSLRMIDGKIAAIEIDDLQQLSTAVIRNLSTDQIQALSTDQVQALTGSQVGASGVRAFS